MDFSLTEEQENLRDRVREFASRELQPIAAEIDLHARFPHESIKKMASLKLMGMNVPEKYGGAGLDTLSYIIAVEEIARHCASTAVIMSVNNSLVCYPLDAFGSHKQKVEFLTPLAKGEKLGAFALTEPQAGSDAAAQRTSAVRKGDEYILSGSKLFITNGGVADTLIVFAVTDKSKGAKGISAFVVDANTEGVSAGPAEDKLGIRASATTEIVFEECHIPKKNLLGAEGEGFKIAMMTLDGGRIGIAAQALGIAQAALDECIKYARQRVQFSKPIARFQAVQWMIADMATEIDAARLLVYRAACAKDKGYRYSRLASMAKLYASEVAVRAAAKAVQIHGAHGFSARSPVERLFRDAKITEIYEGTSEVQRLVISADLLK